MHGRLVDFVSGSPGSQVIVMEDQGSRFRAELVGSFGKINHLPGSILKLTGVCANSNATSPSGDRRQRDFTLLVHTMKDIALITPPPWWTPDRIWKLIASLATILFAIGIWNLLLQRRVTRQTQLIQQKLEHELLWEERNRIARELHDTLEQHLTGITMQIDTLAANPTASPLRRSLSKVKAMLNHSRAEAKNSIWDLRSRTLELGGLQPALEEIARNFDTGDKRPVTIETKGKTRRLGRQTEFHLMRIAQEAVTNSSKHGKATDISVTLRLQRRSVLPLNPRQRNFVSRGIRRHQHRSLRPLGNAGTCRQNQSPARNRKQPRRRNARPHFQYPIP